MLEPFSNSIDCGVLLNVGGTGVEGERREGGEGERREGGEGERREGGDGERREGGEGEGVESESGHIQYIYYK